MGIRKKQMFETSDGKLFSSWVQAERWEREKEAFNKAYDKHACYGKFEFSDHEQFAGFIREYAEILDNVKENYDG